MRVLVLVALLASACSSFGSSGADAGSAADAGDQQTGDAAADAGNEATGDAATDAAKNDAAAQSDAGGLPILGTTTVLPGYWYNTPPGVPADAFQYVANYTGTITKITVFLDERTSAGCTVQVGLYSDQANGPGNLLTSGTVSSATKDAWNTASVPPATVTGGQKYWLAFLNPKGVATLSLRITNAGGAAMESAPDLAALPATWTTSKTENLSPASAFAMP
jgi:hypothetical protein